MRSNQTPTDEAKQSLLAGGAGPSYSTLTAQPTPDPSDSLKATYAGVNSIYEQIKLSAETINTNTTDVENNKNYPIETLQKNITELFTDNESTLTGIAASLEAQVASNPIKQHKKKYYSLVTIAILATLYEAAYEKFTWDTLKDVINGNPDNNTPALIRQKNLQSIFTILRIVLITGDTGANICAIDITGSPEEILKIWFNKAANTVKERSVLERVTADVIPLFSIFNYMGGLFADMAGINSMVPIQGARYALNLAAAVLVISYYYMMYAASIEEFRELVHQAFNRKAPDTTSEALPNRTLWVRRYDFAKTASVYTTIRVVSFLFLGELGVKMLAESTGRDFNSTSMQNLNIAAQVLVGFGTLSAIINSQMIPRFQAVFPSNDQEFIRFLSQYRSTQRKKLAHVSLACAIGLTLGSLPSYLTYTAIMAVDWGTSTGLGMTAAILAGFSAGLPLLLLENAAQTNRDNVEIFNRHRNIKTLFDGLLSDCSTITQKDHSTLSMQDMADIYKKVKESVDYLRSRDGQAMTEVLNDDNKQKIRLLTDQVSSLKENFEKLFELYGEQEKQTELVTGSLPQKMYTDIQSLRDESKANDASISNPSWGDKLSTVASGFFNFSTQCVRQLMLLGFFSSLSKSYGLGLDYETIVVAVVSLGTANSLANAPNYQYYMKEGIARWRDRISSGVSFFSSFCKGSSEETETSLEEKIRLLHSG